MEHINDPPGWIVICIIPNSPLIFADLYYGLIDSFKYVFIHFFRTFFEHKIIFMVLTLCKIMRHYTGLNAYL